jgi:hypothetical protein
VSQPAAASLGLDDDDMIRAASELGAGNYSDEEDLDGTGETVPEDIAAGAEGVEKTLAFVSTQTIVPLPGSRA